MLKHAALRTASGVMLAPAVLLLAACTGAGSSAGSPPPPPPVSAAALTGTNWTIVQIDSATPKSPRAKAGFTADRASFSAGCNGLGGTWRIEGARLVGGPYMSTMMFCDGLMEQERALAALLAEKPVLKLENDTLTLSGIAHSATLKRAE